MNDSATPSHVVVAKIGSSSVTDETGLVNEEAIAKFCAGIADIAAAGHPIVAVTSGAIAAGLTALGLGGDQRPKDAQTLQAVASIGQTRLMAVYERELAAHGLIAGQVLLTPLDFVVRDQYLQARSTLKRLLALGVVPVVNENDATADDEIRFGDNDRLAALVAHLVGAGTLVLLTDTAGLYTADPRVDADATLIEDITASDRDLDAAAGGAGTVHGSGGMASKLAAARIAAWSGVRAVIAQASRPDVLADAVAGAPGVGTVMSPRVSTLSARKLWIAFARPAQGEVHIDAGAVRALVERRRSLLPAGVVKVTGSFGAGDVIDVHGPEGEPVAKGIARVDDVTMRAAAGHQTGDLDGDAAGVAMHRDDLVILVEAHS